tara:strand:- start:4493 stop:4825 length:333 start_codon:yes stop_codon:yes gene_type:complete
MAASSVARRRVARGCVDVDDSHTKTSTLRDVSSRRSHRARALTGRRAFERTVPHRFAPCRALSRRPRARSSSIDAREVIVTIITVASPRRLARRVCELARWTDTSKRFVS